MTVMIAEAAKRAGVSTKTLRRLEERGLLKPRRNWYGLRDYSDADLKLVARYVARKLKRQRRDRATGQFLKN
jgi:DNA-binding transcriptional MerR regulator